MKLIKIIIKKPFFSFILGFIMCCTMVVLAEIIPSDEVLYDNSLSKSDYENVQDALDDLYSKILYSGTGIVLDENSPYSINTSIQGGLYRYQGTNADNYICFGTTNKDTCLSDTERYMYRIIGINQNGDIKLIKKEALSTRYAWHSNNSYTQWPNSNLYNGLNGSYFLTNTYYIPSNDWSDRIAVIDWHYGDITNSSQTASELIIIESQLPTVSAKIGLMHLDDYYYGLPGGNNCVTNSNTCKTSWIYLFQTQNDPNSMINNSSSNNYAERFMTGSGSQSYGNYYPWTITYSGQIETNCSYGYAATALLVRPVFYLKTPSVYYQNEISSGSGTLSDPYILSQ